MGRIDDIMNEISPARMKKVILSRKIKGVFSDYIDGLITRNEAEEILIKIAEEYAEVVDESKK